MVYYQLSGKQEILIRHFVHQYLHLTFHSIQPPKMKNYSVELYYCRTCEDNCVMWKWVGLDRIVAGWIKVQISRSPGVRSRNCNFFTMCQRTPLSSWQWREPVCDPGGETGMEGGGSSLWIPEIPSRNFSGKPFSSLIRLLSVEWSHSQLFWHTSKSCVMNFAFFAWNPFNLPRVVGWYHWNLQNRPKGALFRGDKKSRIFF